MILSLLSLLLFRPVMTEADVTTSNGKHYQVETCFKDPRHLTTRFVYPDRSATYRIEGDAATTAENDAAPIPASDAEKRFALGHNFHAIYFNLNRLLSGGRPGTNSAGDGSLKAGRTGALIYGGAATSLLSDSGRVEGFRFDSPDTTPIQIRFSEWDAEGRVPYRMVLTHAGVTYDYRYRRIEFRC